MTVNELLSMLIALVILALVVYLLFWLLGQFPMPQPVRVTITVLVALGVFVVLLRMFGIWGIWP